MGEKKTVGIIGKGERVRGFFYHLAKNRELATDLLPEVERFLFFNHDHPSKESFAQSLAVPQKNKENEQPLPPISESLEFIIKKYVDGKTKFNISDFVFDSDSDFDSDFEDFVNKCGIIIDASEGYQPESLYGYAEGLAKGSSSGKLNCASDYAAYIAYADETPGRRNVRTKDEFEKSWQESKKLLEEIHSFNQTYPIGLRSYKTIPFSYGMLRERGKRLAKAIAKGIRPLPTYLNLVNEPCLTSSILGRECPEMIDYIVGLTGYDLKRLEDDLNEKYAVVKEKAGLKNVILKVGVGGFHDTYVMVPFIYPQRDEDIPLFHKLLEHISYPDMYTFLQTKMGEYYHTHPRKISDEQVDLHTIETLLHALRSRGKALSVFPEEGRPLSNGYFHAGLDRNDPDADLFLVGSHRFCNGKPVGEALRKNEFIAQKEQDVQEKMREMVKMMEKFGKERDVQVKIMDQVLDPLNKDSLYVLEGKSSEAEKVQKEQKGKEVPSSPTYYVGMRAIENVDGKEHHRGKVIRVSTDKQTPPEGATCLFRGEYQYHSLLGFDVDDVSYIATTFSDSPIAGLARTVGIDICQSKTGNEVKRRKISFPEGTGKPLQLVGMRNSDSPALLALHEEIGLLEFPLAEFIRCPSLALEYGALDSYLLYRRQGTGPLRAAVDSDRVIVTEGSTAYMHEGDGQVGKSFYNLFEIPFPITALSVDKDFIVVGTTPGKVYVKGIKLGEIPHPVRNVAYAQYNDVPGIIAHGIINQGLSKLYFLNGEETKVISDREVDAFHVHQGLLSYVERVGLNNVLWGNTASASLKIMLPQGKIACLWAEGGEK